MKKAISWLLCICMTLLMISTSGLSVAFAQTEPTLDFAEEFVDPHGMIQNTAALLLHSANYTQGQVVTDTFNGVSYSFTVGTNAFTTIAEARSAGKTQIILTAGTYAGITIDGSIEIYGPGYAENPNVISEDRTEPWTLNPTFEASNLASITGETVITAAATPTTEAGTRIVFKGVSFGNRLMDVTRTVSVYKTEILIENCMLSHGGSGFVYRFANPNAGNTDSTKPNIDELTMKNCRYNFKQGLNGQRVFTENSPSKVTIDGLYFDNDFPTLGYPKWQSGVNDGSYVVKNCYFKNYKRVSDSTGSPKNAVIFPTGHAQYCDASDKNTSLLFENNIVIDVASNAFNSKTFYFSALYPDAFDSIEFVGNTFIDTNNYLSTAVIGATHTYAPYNKDYSDVISFENNRFIGYSPYISFNSQTSTLTGKNTNYYAPYTADFKDAQSGTQLFGVLAGKDYYLDYSMTTLASSLYMTVDRPLAVVNNETRTASIVVAEGENYAPNIKTADGQNSFLLYSDKACLQSVGVLNADNIGNGVTLYAKTTNSSGVSVVYEVYVTVGNLDAIQPETILLDERTADMPYGTQFTVNFKGTDYVFTAGVNAFPSLSQITSNDDNDVSNVIVTGVYNSDAVATGSYNIIGDDAVFTSDIDSTSPIKIACVGDAITQGTGVTDSAQTYPAQLEASLNSKYGEGKYTVANFGLDGATSTIHSNQKIGNYNYWSYKYSVPFYKSIDYNPDIVILMMGANDTMGQVFTSADFYKEQYQELIDTYKNLPSKPTVIIAGAPAMSNGVRADLLTNAILPIQKQLAKENGLIYIDTYTDTLANLSDTSLFSGDLGNDMKCTASGYAFISNIIETGMASAVSATREVVTDGITVDTTQRVNPAEKIKIACVGDSLTYGDKSSMGYPVYLAKTLGDGYDIRNFGECGAVVCDMSTYNYASGGTNWVYTETDRYKYSLEWTPDIVLLMLGTNDSGTHLTNFHDLTWDGGAQSSAALEVEKDYKALVEKYQSLGATVYCLSIPSGKSAEDREGTSIKMAYINPIIEKVALETGCSYVDTYTATKEWDDSIYNDTVHLKEAGYEALAGIITKNVFGKFTDSYYDKQGEITKDAVIIDASASGIETGTEVEYFWEGTKYKFTWGVNAFASIDDVIVYANANNITKIQALIPENDFITENNKYFWITKDVTNITSIEVFGQNRTIDPNDKSASVTDPSADWTLNSQWDKYSQNGGTSAMGAVIINSTNLAGKLTFKGITFRDIFYEKSRAVGTAEDPRNLDVLLENCIADFTALSKFNGMLFELKSPRAANTGADYGYNDSFTVKNFRVESYFYKATSYNRFVDTGNMNNMIFDGFYFNENNNYLNTVRFSMSQFGYVGVTSASAQTGSTIFKNCNIRNTKTLKLTLSGYNNTVYNSDTLTERVVFNNNIIYNCSDSSLGIYLQPAYFSSLSICDNIFINTVSGQPVIGSTSADNTVDYVDKIGYVATGNRFVLNDITVTRYLKLGNSTNVDSTGTYLAASTEDFVNGANGVEINFGTAQYYYVDFLKNVKNTDFAITDANLGEKVENVTIESSVISADSIAGNTVDTLEFTHANPLVDVNVYRDEACTEKLNTLTLSLTNSTDIYYVRMSYKNYIGTVYTLKFKLGEAKSFAENFVDPLGIIQSTAVLYNPALSTSATGDAVTAVWNDIQYVFVYGTNAFSDFESIKTAFGDEDVQIILPAGEYSQIDILGSWSIFGEDYGKNPNNLDTLTINENWGKTGTTYIKDANIVVGNTPTDRDVSIMVSGVRMNGRFIDTAREVSEFKTSIVLKNIVYNRNLLTDGTREFDLQNANALKDTGVNIDSFTLENIYYTGTNISSEHSLFEDVVTPEFTIDGFVSANNTPSFGDLTVSGSAQKLNFTLKNSYFSGCKSSAAEGISVANFVGHNATVSSSERANRDTQLNVINNTFINCGSEAEYNGQTVRTVIELYPQSFSSINFTGNEFVSTRDFNYIFVTANSADFAVNAGDYSNNVTFKNNRVIGIMATFFLNEDTVVDHSENYFATYTSNYKSAAIGDIPSDYDADVYLDYAMTVKRSDMAPVITNLNGFTVDNETFTAYGYADKDITPRLASGCKLYSDKACTSKLKVLDIHVGETAKAYIKVTNGNISKVYTLYVMGVKDVNDIADAVVNPASVEGIDNPYIYYPTIYGAPDGVTVYTYYNGVCYGFETGKRVVTSTANMIFCKNDLLVPDDITEINFSIISGIKLHSKSANLSGVEVRKLRVACIGDSITQGVGAGSTTDYPTFVQNYLGTDEFTVQNFGKGSATVQSDERGYMVFAQAQHQASLEFKPDVVICALGTNDSRYNIWTSNSAFIDKYIEIIDTYRDLDTQPAIYVTKTLQRADDLMNNARVEKNTIHLDEYIAKMVGGKIIDTYTEMRPYTTDTGYFGDALHPTAVGYEKMGKFIASEIVKNMNKSSETGLNLNGINLTGEIASEISIPVTLNGGSICIGSEGEALINGNNVKSLTLTNTVVTDGENVTNEIDLDKFMAYASPFSVKDSDTNVITMDGDYKIISAGSVVTDLSVTMASMEPPIVTGDITEDVSYSFESETGILTIEGLGYCPEYTSDSPMFDNEFAQKVKHIVLDDKVAGFGAYSFVNFTNLETVTGGENMRYLGIWAFSGLEKLTTVEFLSADMFGVLGYGAFADCTALKDVTLSASLKTLGGSAFKNCTSIETLVIPEGIKTVPHYLAKGCTSLKTLELKGAETIDNDAFYGCTSLNSVILNEGLETIGVWAFAGAKINQINLPATLSSVGDYAFYWANINKVTGKVTDINIGIENKWLTDKF